MEGTVFNQTVPFLCFDSYFLCRICNPLKLYETYLTAFSFLTSAFLKFNTMILKIISMFLPKVTNEIFF